MAQKRTHYMKTSALYGGNVMANMHTSPLIHTVMVSRGAKAAMEVTPDDGEDTVIQALLAFKDKTWEAIKQGLKELSTKGWEVYGVELHGTDGFILLRVGTDEKWECPDADDEELGSAGDLMATELNK